MGFFAVGGAGSDNKDYSLSACAFDLTAWRERGRERERERERENTEILRGTINLIRQYTHSNQFTDVGMLQCYNELGRERDRDRQTARQRQRDRDRKTD